MIRLPSHLHRLLSQIIGFAFVVSSTLFANWLWQKYTTEIDLKNERMEEQNDFLGIVRQVIEETEYNCTPGIGDVKCPFHLEAHYELLGASLIDCLPKTTKELTKEIHRLGGLCNGGRTSRKITPSLVKTKSLQLKEALMKALETEAIAKLDA